MVGVQKKYGFSLAYTLRQIPRSNWVEIIVNHKFAVYKGFKKSLASCDFIDLIDDVKEQAIEYYEYEQAFCPIWKVYINDDLLEKLVLDRENEWYDTHNGIKTKVEVNKNVDEI